VATSVDSNGTNYLSFWDCDSGQLLHREATQWKLDVLLWAETAALVLVCGKGDTPGSSSAITVGAQGTGRGGAAVRAGLRSLLYAPLLVVLCICVFVFVLAVPSVCACLLWRGGGR
jgi:hypothetical protein